ncbi:MAG: HIT family protein [Rhodoferax sp.]|uniref:HIT family protein n=1 Tax=Rhodoferax sp. TaxID=50421 RepID=UPI0026132C5B|nr:HIT family protein [Rhodoferax sp.]MDD5332157.1 HIT family protein [Rhodoferax sp.]
MTLSTCPLCAAPGGALVFEGEKFRVIRADEAGFPAFYRVVWTAHVAEFSDLDAEDRNLCMAAVAVVEQALRAHLQPTKINLAALGNLVPHLHWHVIARFDWDTHFPAPVWAAAKRPPDQARQSELCAKLKAAEQAMQLQLV